MKFRNTKTGVVVNVSSEIKGEWEPVKKTPTSPETKSRRTNTTKTSVKKNRGK